MDFLKFWTITTFYLVLNTRSCYYPKQYQFIVQWTAIYYVSIRCRNEHIFICAICKFMPGNANQTYIRKHILAIAFDGYTRTRTWILYSGILMCAFSQIHFHWNFYKNQNCTFIKIHIFDPFLIYCIVLFQIMYLYRRIFQ